MTPGLIAVTGATGEMDVVAYTVRTLAGHRPQTLADYFREHPRQLPAHRHVTPGARLLAGPMLVCPVSIGFGPH